MCLNTVQSMGSNFGCSVLKPRNAASQLGSSSGRQWRHPLPLLQHQLPCHLHEEPKLKVVPKLCRTLASSIQQ